VQIVALGQFGQGPQGIIWVCVVACGWFGCAGWIVGSIVVGNIIVGSIIVGSIIIGSIIIVLVGMVLESIQLSARSWWIACWSMSRLAIWESAGWYAVGVGVELVLLVAWEPMVVVIIVAFVIAAVEYMIAHCSARRLLICGSGWGARGVCVELGLLVGELMGIGLHGCSRAGTTAKCKGTGADYWGEGSIIVIGDE